MAYFDSGILIVRNLISDTSDTPTYDDDRIAQTLTVAGLIVSQEFPLTIKYTFDMNAPSISPDPTDPNLNNGQGDTLFIVLDTLKAACLLNINSMQTAVGNSIFVKDGDSSVDTTKSMNGYQYLLEYGICSTYEAIKKRNLYLNSMNAGRAVMTGFSHPNLLISSSYALGYYLAQFNFRL